jgi:hypothetical protein
VGKEYPLALLQAIADVADEALRNVSTVLKQPNFSTGTGTRLRFVSDCRLATWVAPLIVQSLAASMEERPCRRSKPTTALPLYCCSRSCRVWLCSPPEKRR